LLFKFFVIPFHPFAPLIVFSDVLVLNFYYTLPVNITFNYDGKTGLDGATYGILGYATTNDSSQAIYDMYDSQVTVEVGENTRTAFIQGWTPVPETKYYFWLKVISAAYNVSDSSWSKVAEFTYTK
jgi:hypothetical protein